MNLDPSLNPSRLARYIDSLVEEIIAYSPKLISAIIILIIGFYAIRFTDKIIRKAMTKRKIDPSLISFSADVVLWIFRIILFITIVGKLGIETSSFAAMLGAVGLAVGLAFQGSLSNFAGGMLIIFFKPFKVGHTIEALGNIGTVKDIQILSTKLINGNNQTIFIPNGILANTTIINYSLQGTRRADLTFAISYDTDIKKAKDIITTILNNNPKILKTPVAEVSVKNLTDNSIQLAVRPWATNENYNAVCSGTLENCKLAFDAAGIAIQPFARESS